jgi:hypothetical protein
MTYHARLNVGHMDFGHAGQRTERIKAKLEAERKVQRTASSGSYDERVASLNIADLEAALERAEASDQAREEWQRERQTERDAKAKEHQEAQEAALKARLRSDFMVQLGAREEDFERLYPQLRDRHLIEESGKAMEQARARYRNIF